ncbi:hypothetical protein HK405_014053 [Cladochytrium tenue]|nr:hypothetical protein HK405_014053 [Cladochytrium tenue]
MLAAIFVAPLMYLFYSGAFYVYLRNFSSMAPRARLVATALSLFVNPLVGYTAMRTSEVGFDILRGIPSLVLGAFAPSASTRPLRSMRADLRERIAAAADEFGRRLYGRAFDRIAATAARNPQLRRGSWPDSNKKTA